MSTNHMSVCPLCSRVAIGPTGRCDWCSRQPMAGMASLADVLPDIYGPITIRLDPRADRFVRHLAKIVSITPGELCLMLLMERLEEEARQFYDFLTTQVGDLSPGEVEEEAKRKIMEPLVPDES